jgi:hypothetical protein
MSSGGMTGKGGVKDGGHGMMGVDKVRQFRVVSKLI